MRRTTAILTLSLCAVAGCRGGAAQEPYDGLIATNRVPAGVQSAAQASPPESDRIAAGVDVPWTIALLSDAKTSPTRRAGKVIIVQTEPEPEVDLPEIVAGDEADLHLTVNAGAAEESASAPKACSGVVKTRS
jgi:hypothetical protein